MLKLSDLAARGDFDAGPLQVSPARRLIEGPAGSANVEPIVMKVLLLLLDAAGSVVTRDELFGNAWGGVFVGDDSLNRAIARVRKIANETAPGLFEIETIPRTGYRLTGPIVDHLQSVAQEPAGEPARAISRRALVATGAASVAALAAGGWWWKQRATNDRRFSDLVERARNGLEYGDRSNEPAVLLRQAVALRPDHAAAKGLLAFSLVANADDVNRGTDGLAADEARAAAEQCLRMTPKDPNARLAMVHLERSTLDLVGTESRLAAILKDSPDNLFVMQDYWNLLQNTGQSRRALALVDRSLERHPLAATANFPLAQLLWINGRVPEADRVIERALTTWPNHRYVRFARFTILAFTGREAAARVMMRDPAARPQFYTPQAIDLWLRSLDALERPNAVGIARLEHAYRVAVAEKPRFANQAVMVLSALGNVDAAFDFANSLLLFRAGAAGKALRSTAWRFTPWLFVPPVAAMRADPRFIGLCDGIGLTDYWRARGIRPDYPIGHA